MERYIVLNAIDRLWQEHLYAMDALREAVCLRAYGQKDPLIEYKNEAYEMFVELMGNIKNEVLNNLFRSTSNLMAFEKFLAKPPVPSPPAAGRSHGQPPRPPSSAPGHRSLPPHRRVPPIRMPQNRDHPAARKPPKPAETTPAPAEAARNTRIAAAGRPKPAWKLRRRDREDLTPNQEACMIRMVMQPKFDADWKPTAVFPEAQKAVEDFSRMPKATDEQIREQFRRNREQRLRMENGSPSSRSR